MSSGPIPAAGELSQQIGDVVNNLLACLVQPIDDAAPLDIDAVLRLALDAETALRRLFGGMSLDDYDSLVLGPHVGLIDLFSSPLSARYLRQRKLPEGKRRYDIYVMPHPLPSLAPIPVSAMVDTIDNFQRNWDILTHSVLRGMNANLWENVIVAGGSVLASLMPFSQDYSLKKINKYFQLEFQQTDVDLFLWGLSEDQAKLKMIEIYDAICNSSPWDVICVRRANMITIHSNFPSRPVQIVLRLYKSPAEVLAGFDLDCCCCAFNGTDVFVNPRALIALITLSNTIDVTRRSPSYETRLAKYAQCGFQIYVPDLNRNSVIDLLYEPGRRNFSMGLAQLLIYERVDQYPTYYFYLSWPKSQAAPPSHYLRANDRANKFEHDTFVRTEDRSPRNNYEFVQIPYGKAWDPKAIKAFVKYVNDRVNSPFHPDAVNLKTRYEADNLQEAPPFPHRHIVCSGSMTYCIGDFCTDCPPPVPGYGFESVYAKYCFSGPVSFIRHNPRAQLIGSFNPVEVGDWTASAYIIDDTGEDDHATNSVNHDDEEIVVVFVDED